MAHSCVLSMVESGEEIHGGGKICASVRRALLAKAIGGMDQESQRNRLRLPIIIALPLGAHVMLL
ncbi:hypothetical protein BN2497_8551 [Janthinobacterium sp. CG23_2]|nr:hypothetical protein BN2497_8551 [Janthinobacterium sp. CG23_2]CUU30673.1 hypothetical protein BN3177_8551 [Janthinobacterium sp. CG23_2]